MKTIGAFIAVVALVGAAVVSVGAEPASAGSSFAWKQVSTGHSHTCAVSTDGRLFCWGFDADGRLGDSDGNDSSAAPLEVFGGASNWKQVDAGNTHTCATKTNGRLFCWGNDGAGQLGDGTVSTPLNNFTPVEVAGGATNWKQVDAAVAHTCATKKNGRLFCWGNDTQGQRGDGAFGSPDANPLPAQVVGNATNWKAVTVGDLHTCATKVNRRLFCWGLDESGRLGDGTEGFPFPNPSPVQVVGHLKTWTQVAAGQDHTCARKKNGRLFCWGNDGDGALGDGTTVMPTANPAPVQVSGGATDWKKFAAGEDHTCATKANGHLFCWGNDTAGQLGDGAPGMPNDNPIPVQVLLI